MKELMARPVSRIWLLLIVITCITTWGLSENFVPAVIATVGIMILAAIKVGLVVSYFMELRFAPIPWQVYFAGWIVVTTALLLGFYALS